jgi:Protein of unknown function (DUF1091)
MSVLKADTNGTYQPTMFKARIDGCLLMGKKSKNPMLQIIYDQVRKFGRVPLNCPIKKVYLKVQLDFRTAGNHLTLLFQGFYFVKNFKFDPMNSFPGIKITDKYLVILKIDHVINSKTIFISLFNVHYELKF